jgi:hypothetical protein
LRTVVDDCGRYDKLARGCVQRALALEYHERSAHAGRRQRHADSEALSDAGAESDTETEADEQRTEDTSHERHGDTAHADLLQHGRLHLQASLHNLCGVKVTEAGLATQRRSGATPHHEHKANLANRAYRVRERHDIADWRAHQGAKEKLAAKTRSAEPRRSLARGPSRHEEQQQVQQLVEAAVVLRFFRHCTPAGRTRRTSVRRRVLLWPAQPTRGPRYRTTACIWRCNTLRAQRLLEGA